MFAPPANEVPIPMPARPAWAQLQALSQSPACLWRLCVGCLLFTYIFAVNSTTSYVFMCALAVGGFLGMTLCILRLLFTRHAPLRRHVPRPRYVDISHLRLMLADRDFDSNDYEALLALDDSIPTAALHGAAPEEIHRLPTYLFEKKEVRSTMPPDLESGPADSPVNKPPCCSVCLETYSAGETLRILPCLHQFHQECIDTWLEQKADCPVCKVSIRS